MDGFPNLPETDLRPKGNHPQVTNTQSSAILDFHYGPGDVPHPIHQAKPDHVDLLVTLFDEAPAGIRVAVGKLLLYLAKAQPIGNQFLRIKAHLVFFRNTAE